MRWMGQMRSAYKILLKKREAKRLFGSRLVDNIKIDLEEILNEFIWLRIRSSGGLMVDMVMNLRVP
jgi:hypothetical protein